MPVHGRALIKSFLVYKGTMAENMANQQGALSDPKATCDPANEEIVDIEYELLVAESDIVDEIDIVDDLLPQDRLSALSRANLLKLLPKHRFRMKILLASESVSAPPKSKTDRILLEVSGQQTLGIALETALQPETAASFTQ